MEHGARSGTFIVGGGTNGCILHYIENSAPLKEGDLVLIDAGCELDCYARHYPHLPGQRQVRTESPV